MKIYLAASKVFYDKIAERKVELEALGHEVVPPSTLEDPGIEHRIWGEGGHEAHVKLLRQLFQDSEDRIAACDAIYLLNYKKKGVAGYVGGAGLIELYIAHRERKQIFLEEKVKEGPMYDEIMGFDPVFVEGELERIPLISGEANRGMESLVEGELGAEIGAGEDGVREDVGSLDEVVPA